MLIVTLPRSQTNAESDEQLSDGPRIVAAGVGFVPLVIQSETGKGVTSEYAFLVHGDVDERPDLTSGDAAGTVAPLDDSTWILSGSVGDGAAGFAVTGDLLGVTVTASDGTDARSSITLDGEAVDPSRLPSVDEAIARRASQEPVLDPFPVSGELGKPPGDPLDPEEYVITVEPAAYESDAPAELDGRTYAFDVDGAILDAPDGATVSEPESRVVGELDGSAETITVRGVIRWIETDGGVDVSVRERT